MPSDERPKSSSRLPSLSGPSFPDTESPTGVSASRRDDVMRQSTNGNGAHASLPDWTDSQELRSDLQAFTARYGRDVQNAKVRDDFLAVEIGKLREGNGAISAALMENAKAMRHLKGEWWEEQRADILHGVESRFEAHTEKLVRRITSRLDDLAATTKARDDGMAEQLRTVEETSRAAFGELHENDGKIAKELANKSRAMTDAATKVAAHAQTLADHAARITWLQGIKYAGMGGGAIIAWELVKLLAHR